MRKLGIVFLVTGMIIVGWFSYDYWSGMQSVTKVSGDVVKVKNDVQTGSDSIRELELEQDLEEIFNPDQASNIDHVDGEDIATLVIPSVDLAFDVFMGTGSDALAKGVGMYESEWTTTPDLGGHTVLSGHRDSVFRPVGDLVDGEAVYVSYQGEDYEYKINKTWITDEHDTSVIVEKEEPTLTLSTCYPFEFIGSAPDRYIVEAEFVRKGDLLDLSQLNK